MTRHRMLSLAAALVAALGLSGCQIGPVNLDDFFGTPSVEEARAERQGTLAPVVADTSLKQPGTLTVGIPATQSAPLAMTSTDGTQVGLDLDMAHALADELGLASVSFVSVSDVEGALADQCDVVMGVESGDAGDATVVGGYAQSAVGVFTRGDAQAPIDASALDGATVGIQEGSVSAVTLDSYEISAVHSPCANLNEAFDSLEQGTVDYVICDAYAGAYLATAYSDVSFVGTLDDPVMVGVAVSGPELQSAVQSALETVQSNGVGAIALAGWVGELPTLTADVKITGLVERTDGEKDGDAEADADDADAQDADASADSDASAE